MAFKLTNRGGYMGFVCKDGNKLCNGCMSCQEPNENIVLCEVCEQVIEDDYYYVIGGTVLCKDCLDDEYKVYKEG